MPVVVLDHAQLAMPAGEEARGRDFYTGLLGNRLELVPFVSAAPTHE